MKKFFLLLFLFISLSTSAEDGSRLWLRYEPISNTAILTKYRTAIQNIRVVGETPILKSVQQELSTALPSLLNKKLTSNNRIGPGTLIAARLTDLPKEIQSILGSKAEDWGDEGFHISRILMQGHQTITITANSEAGVLYGAFHFLRMLQNGEDISKISYTSKPAVKFRLLNHWDNLTRYVERGYAGISIFDWHRLPGYIDSKMETYARANASIGINGTVLTNVNANALVLTPMYLDKVKALADVFRPWGLKVYLTARFSAPIELGGLKTADPLDPQVQQWWREKVKEIYQYIPDFGGFLVKANSEGQPGPQNYKRSHSEGANLLADAVQPFGGIVIWRAFVYSNELPEDRCKQAYSEFKPLDGQFRKNVLVQVKNGPLDFQPREPFHPLFGAMPKTPLVMEFQITQEYLGFATHLVYLPKLFKEVLNEDTYAKGKGSTVAKVVDGSIDGHALTGISGVVNIGNEKNWTGHIFGQANWYGFGRLAWDHGLDEAAIAEEWIRQTFSSDEKVIDPVSDMMMASREAVVNYMTPLGLTHIMGYGHHYGPAPWWDKARRADWNPVYYHKADGAGIGFDRTNAGSDALSQYHPQVALRFATTQNCPDEYLLWFHRVPWDHKMKTGRSLWDEMVHRYHTGVDTVRWMQKQWKSLAKQIDPERFRQVEMLLGVQAEEAVWWRDACLLYFQTFSRLPLPENREKPAHTLEYYMAQRFPYAPGN